MTSESKLLMFDVDYLTPDWPGGWTRKREEGISLADAINTSCGEGGGERGGGHSTGKKGHSRGKKGSRLVSSTGPLLI